MYVATKDQRRAIKRIYDRRPIFKDGSSTQIAQNAGWVFVKVSDLPDNLRCQVTSHLVSYVWLHDVHTKIYAESDEIVTEHKLSEQLTYRQFRKTVANGYDCLMVAWQGMWLGIEKDGYVHS